MKEIGREDLLMKIPALLHASRLGYVYLPREGLNRDRETNILPDILKAALSAVNGREMEADTFSRLMAELREQLNRDDQGEAFYRTIRDGWAGWRLIDFCRPEGNRYHAAAELNCGRGENRFRPDITFFVNGIPLVMMEVKTGEQPRGIRAEYDRMKKRLGRTELRRYLQCTQIWAFTDGNPADDNRLLPEEGSFYAAAGGRDFPIYPWRTTAPVPIGSVRPQNGAEKARILADQGLKGKKRGQGFRQSLSADTPGHRMMTGLFCPERLLMLLRHGICYVEEENPAGEPVRMKRVVNPEQFLLLLEASGKADRGYRNWTLRRSAPGGEALLQASLTSLLRDRYPEREIRWMNPAEVPEKPKRRKREKPGKTGRVLVMPEDGDREGNRGTPWNRNPSDLLIVLKTGAAQEGRNYTYLLECADGSLYCGWTNDLEKRVRIHNAGQGARYTRTRRPVRLVYREAFGTREEAMRREWELKQLSRAQKMRLIQEANRKEPLKET